MKLKCDVYSFFHSIGSNSTKQNGPNTIASKLYANIPIAAFCN